jgi:mannose-1-phosphate guanylyltransferase
MRKHPDDIVVIYPSDHFIRPERAFLSAVSDAIKLVEQNPDRVVLLGAKPTRLELDYGWIQPAGETLRFGSRSFRGVHRFLEKPSEAEGKQALANGALWNTLILIGAVRTFFQLGRYCLPHTMQLLEWLGTETGAPREHEVTQRIYASLPNCNFSSDVLEKAPEFLVVMELTGIEWSDWGRPERIAESILSLGRKPAFPLGLVRDFLEPAGLRPAGHFAQRAILSGPGIG